MIHFSIIIATYNSEKTLEMALISLLDQTEDAFECIICDGASKDSTMGIVARYEPKFKAKNIGYKWISEPDRGIYDAWNKGLQLAQGEWISFLGSDDVYLPDALAGYQKILKSKDKQELPHLLYSNVNYVNGSTILRQLNGTWSWPKFGRYMCIAHVGSFHHRDYFKKYGNFDTSYKICGDYELLLRPRHDLKTLKLNKTTVHMQAGGVSNFMVVKAFQETYRAKITSGSLNKVVAKFDYFLARFKFGIKKLMGKDK
ncbi:MAG: glycosyl transferase [Pseudozobellia sp.]|nr:glycosyl transferase [Pseudozobellia sp.]MBG49187.1 glycosyl transferase [Pseudozobellia sp.]|tara:strand:+ start:2295 stop:3065 length:771 start_codon:yes stop_codon:yes gene_type:complete